MSTATHTALSESPLQAAWRRFYQQRSAVAALLVLAVITSICIIGPWLTYDPTAQNLALGASPPSGAHWLGTDTLGRDLASRVMAGGRLSLLVGVLATAVAVLIGVTYGLVSGLAGGRWDALMMRVVDVLYSFPFMTLVILLVALFGRSFVLLFVAIGLIEWLTMARVVRGQALALKKQDFVTAARAYGASWWRILWHHLLPHVVGIVIIYASLTMPGVMMFEAVLSFLGFGVQPPDASWGVLISEGSQAIQSHPWMLLGPAVVFCLTLLALSVVGDALRDAFDPKSLRE
jgi:oligopeptide transport system permease protein